MLRMECFPCVRSCFQCVQYIFSIAKQFQCSMPQRSSKHPISHCLPQSIDFRNSNHPISSNFSSNHPISKKSSPNFLQSSTVFHSNPPIFLQPPPLPPRHVQDITLGIGQFLQQQSFQMGQGHLSVRNGDLVIQTVRPGVN